jgi:hypothetical protein
MIQAPATKPVYRYDATRVLAQANGVGEWVTRGGKIAPAQCHDFFPVPHSPIRPISHSSFSFGNFGVLWFRNFRWSQ